MKAMNQAAGKTARSRPKVGPVSPAIAAAMTAKNVSYKGAVRWAGQWSDGTNCVDFEVSGYSWASTWPGWAYQSALTALKHKKRLWVFAWGTPHGKNLDAVFLLED